MNLVFSIKAYMGSAMSILVGILFVTFFSSSDIIKALRFLEQNHLIPEEFDGEKRLLTSLPLQEEEVQKNNRGRKKVQTKKSNKLKEAKKLETFSLNSKIFMHLERGHILFIFLTYFFLSISLFNLLKERAKKRLEETYQSKLKNLSKKFCKIEREKKAVYAYGTALKNYENEKTTILEKIFPVHNKVSNVIYEFYSYCSIEVTDNFKVWIKGQVEKNQEKDLSLRSVIKEIRKSFSHKLISQHISLKIRGNDIPLKGVVPSVYFIFYYTLKKVIETLPKDGSIEIILNTETSGFRVLIKDNGYFFSEEKMKDFKLLVNDGKPEFPGNPTYEDIKEIGKICKWEIKKIVREGGFNLTEIIIHKEKAEIIPNRLNIIELKKFRNSEVLGPC